MIHLIVLVRSVLTEDQSWGSRCWRFSNLKLEADKDVSAVMQTWYLNEANVGYFKVGKSFRGNIKGNGHRESGQSQHRKGQKCA